MNEITKIHLGRQPFVIAVDAYKVLQAYLHEIKRQVGKNAGGVVDEIELRMAELLAERGVQGEKVVLAEDVEYLKNQLGAPRDFKDEEEGDEQRTADEPAEAEPVRRLFRDTEHGMIAGVSSGIASYFGIDAVVIRLLFVIATLAGGWGIPVYLVLWLIVPEAKTASDRLQMRGTPVTVGSLKEAVDRTDVPGAARRASRGIIAVVETAAKAILMIVGICVLAAAVSVLLGLVTLGIYAALHDGHLMHGVLEFPVGATEAVVAIAGFAIVTAIAIFMALVGYGLVRRKWSVPGWVVAAIAGLLLVSVAVGGAAVPDTINSVRSRYEAARRVEPRSLQPFDRVRVEAGQYRMAYRYEQSDKYGVELRYLGNVTTKQIKTTVSNKTLVIDTSDFNGGRSWDCDGMCVGPSDFMQVVVLSPDRFNDIRQIGEHRYLEPIDYSQYFMDSTRTEKQQGL